MISVKGINVIDTTSLTVRNKLLFLLSCFAVVQISGNPKLLTAPGPTLSLRKVYGQQVYINSNPLLQNISLPNLQFIQASCFCCDQLMKSNGCLNRTAVFQLSDADHHLERGADCGLRPRQAVESWRLADGRISLRFVTPMHVSDGLQSDLDFLFAGGTILISSNPKLTLLSSSFASYNWVCLRASRSRAHNCLGQTISTIQFDSNGLLRINNAFNKLTKILTTLDISSNPALTSIKNSFTSLSSIAGAHCKLPLPLTLPLF